MPKNIFDSTPNWSYSEADAKAQEKFSIITNETIKAFPGDIHDVSIVTRFDEIRKTPLYPLLKSLPKAVLHHLHFDCNEDQEFYAKHVITDPIVYLGANLKSFEVGTEEQAKQKGWVSMAKARTQFPSEQAFIQAVSNISMLNKEEKQKMIKDPKLCWVVFEQKISGFFPILGSLHLFRKYVDHILRKYVRNGYTRIQFRSFLGTMNEYDEKGNVVSAHPEKKFMEVFDQAYEEVKNDYPFLTVGFIFFGLKMFEPELNEKILTTALEQEWSKTIGIDFVQQEDPWGCIKKYDEVANKVLAKFPNQNIKKVYHVGQTTDHLNNNIQTAINAGTARIGHGINVIHHPEVLQECQQRQICFQKSPCSNLILGYKKDARQGTASLLLGLGIPVTLNPDDPSKFGYEDTTMDYFVTLVSSNWSLKHLKLVAIHSINHSICSQETKKQILHNFIQRWNEWVLAFLNQQ